MRALLFELIIILLYFAEVSPDDTSQGKPKSRKTISYGDLKNISVGGDHIKDEKVIFDPTHSPHLPENLTFSRTLRKMYKENQYMHVTLDDIAMLVEKEVLNETQAILLWDTLIKSKKLNQTELPPNPLIIFLGNAFQKAKEYIGNFPMFLIFMSGYLVLLFIYSYLGLSFYFKHSYWLLLVLSLIFLYNFYFLGSIVSEQLKYSWFVGIINNTIFSALIVAIHSIFCLAKIQSDVGKIHDIIDAESNFPGKLSLSLIALTVGYIFVFLCDSILAQIPFYLSQLYLALLTGKKMTKKLGPNFQPSSILALTSFAAFSFIYIYANGSNAWLPHEGIIDWINSQFGFQLLNAKVDMQYLGYILNATVLLAISPLFLVVQSLNLGKEYMTGKFSYTKVFESIKEAQKKKVFSERSSNRSLWLFTYGMITLIVMVLGFQIRSYYVVVLAIFGLQSFNGVYAKERGVTNTIFFYSAGFLTVNAAFLLGQMEDSLTIQIFGENRGGYFLMAIEFAIRSVLNYYAFAICSSNITSGDAQSIESFTDLKNFCIKYFVNYFFAVYLIVMADLEKSFLHSLFYSISSVIFFSKVLIYSSQKSDPNTRLFISFSTLLSGLRIAVLAPNLHIPFYFGGVLMNFSLFTTYTNFAHFMALPITAFYFIGTLIMAINTQSSFMMIFTIINFCGLFATRLGETKQKMLRIFLFLLAINGLLIIASKFSLDIYFNPATSLLNSWIPGFVIRIWESLLDRQFFPEHIFVKGFVNFFAEIAGLPTFP